MEAVTMEAVTTDIENIKKLIAESTSKKEELEKILEVWDFYKKNVTRRLEDGTIIRPKEKSENEESEDKKKSENEESENEESEDEESEDEESEDEDPQNELADAKDVLAYNASRGWGPGNWY